LPAFGLGLSESESEILFFLATGLALGLTSSDEDELTFLIGFLGGGGLSESLETALLAAYF